MRIKFFSVGTLFVSSYFINFRKKCKDMVCSLKQLSTVVANFVVYGKLSVVILLSFFSAVDSEKTKELRS